LSLVIEHDDRPLGDLLDESIDRARRGLPPKRSKPVDPRVRFFTRRLDLFWYAVKSGAPIPPEMRERADNLLRAGGEVSAGSILASHMCEIPLRRVTAALDAAVREPGIH
jgi:hypothetical protein